MKKEAIVKTVKVVVCEQQYMFSSYLLLALVSF